ncbi:MAG: hypothetical protein HKN39_02855 [Flavobacteriales bacterium]|nr:hypothetical protein [Flavobacteriales bacterium]
MPSKRECPDCSKGLRRVKSDSIVYKIQKQVKGDKVGYYKCSSCGWRGILDRDTNVPVSKY